MVRTTILLPMLALLLGPPTAGCAGSPAADATAATAKPVNKARELAHQVLGPPTLQRAVDSLRKAVAGIGVEAGRLADVQPAASQLAAIDRDRMPALVRDLRAVPGRELDRLPDALELEPLTGELDPHRFGRDLRATTEQMPRLLWLERQPMEEHDDSRHRTDPDDVHPEASLWRRILRRLGM